MFKEIRFNKILIITFAVILILTSAILLIGEKSTPSVISYEISDLKDGAAPAKTQISILFNRVMNKDVVEKNFSITPAVKGNFAWSGKKLVFTPKSNLIYGQEYKISIDQATDTQGKFMSKSFETVFKVKSNSVFFISGDEKTKGNLVMVNLDSKKIENIIAKEIDSYAIARDGKNIIYTTKTDNPNIEDINIRTISDQTDKRISIPKNIGNFDVDGWRVSKMLFGKNYIAILAQGYNKKQLSFVTGNLIFLYDTSTSEISLFQPKNKINDSDAMFFTPDFENLVYRDSGQYYSYASIKDGSYTTFGKYISIQGFNYKQDKIAITDYDSLSTDGQYVAYIDTNRKKEILTNTNEFAQEPQFANTSDNIVFAQKLFDYDNFGIFGISIKDTSDSKSSIKNLYFDKNYSSELPQWSPDDKFIAFERYDYDEIKESLSGNRIIFNTAKPENGEIAVVNSNTKELIILAQKGHDINWDR